MSGKEHTQSVTVDAEEAATTQYLRQHPDFFKRHPDLLNDLNVPHVERGAAVSLIERQVDVLREEKRTLDQKLHELVELARQNELLTQRLQNVAVFVAGCADLIELFDNLPPILCREFTLDSACLKLASRHRSSRTEFVSRRDESYAALLERTAHGRSVCDDRLPQSLVKYLFGDSADMIRSSAVIPLIGKKPIAVLALGTQDPARFRPEMGTVYLDRLGELIEAGLRRLHQ